MHYILVHGAWQGSWCWERLAKILRRYGHEVTCVDLPGHKPGKLPISDITYEMYYQSLEQEILRHKDPVTLVAHSMSGMMAAPLLDRHPEKISHLFLIAAFVVQNGQTLIDMAIAGGPSEIPNVILPEDEKNVQKLDLTKVKSALYHDCPSEIADWAIRQLQPQPAMPFFTPIHWNDSGKTRHKRTYLLCEDDRDVHPITQNQILSQYPCNVISLKAGHFPFLSMPNELAKILSSI